MASVVTISNAGLRWEVRGVAVPVVVVVVVVAIGVVVMVAVPMVFVAIVFCCSECCCSCIASCGGFGSMVFYIHFVVGFWQCDYETLRMHTVLSEMCARLIPMFHHFFEGR